MDRNTVIGLLLIAVILIGYSLFTKPSREEQAEMQRIRDSIALAEQIKSQEAGRQEAEASAPDVSRRDTSVDSPLEQESAVQEPMAEQEYIDVYGAFSEAAQGKDGFITLENDRLKIRISRRGGRPYSVELKKYQTHDSLPLILFDGDSTEFGMNFFAQNRSINTNELFFTPGTGESYLDATSQPVSLSMKLPAGEGKYIEYIYSLSPESYMLGFDLRFVNMDELLSRNINFIDFNWNIFVPQQEMGRMNEMNYTTIFLKHFQDEVERLNMRSKKNIQEKDVPTRIRWVAFKQQFFSSVFIAQESFANAYVRSTKLEESPQFLYLFESTIGIPYQPGGEQSVDFSFYFGPNHYNTLKSYNLELQDLVGLGGLMSRVINKYMIIPVFNFLNRYIGNYGLIILILTIMIKLILFPLTYRSYMSMAKMRVLKPEIDEINERIPKEKAMERQQATMALYKKAGVSPLGGCLPMLLQMPILISMFRFFPTSIELRQQGFLWAHDLSTYDSILDLPFNIPMYGDHISLFTLLMTASTILTMKISNQANASQSQMPGMKGMMYIMPIMFMFMLNNWSSALTYYYFLANIITFGQNQLVKQFVDEEALRKKLKSNQKKPAAKKQSGFQKRLEEMAKQRGYNPPKKK
jgi:YidC/Oxa1 family membrane protein insertase